MKAVKIIQAEYLKIVPKRIGFHSLISSVWSLKIVIGGLGLEKLLEIIYSPNSVLHILSGKAIRRTVTDHFLAGSGLKIRLLPPFFRPERTSKNLQ